MLPDFLGIGVAKCGTTWLHELLGTHPDVYVPMKRKEIGYFNKKFDRPIQWYESYFPPDHRAEQYRAVGEIAPQYWGVHIPQRLTEVASIKRLIVMFRDPVDRIYSHYWWVRRIRKYSGSFEHFLEQPNGVNAVQAGEYRRILDKYLKFFDREQLLVLIFERTFADVDAAKGQVARFLQIDADRFPAEAGKAVVNQRMTVKHDKLYRRVRRLGRALRQVGLDSLTSSVKRMGIERLFGARKLTIEPMNQNTRRQLQRHYAADIDRLESLLGMDLSCWSSRGKQGTAEEPQMHTDEQTRTPIDR